MDEYKPEVLTYEDSGDSEFVMFDVPCVYQEKNGYAVIFDFNGNVIGFRWRTETPPRPITSCD